MAERSYSPSSSCGVRRRATLRWMAIPTRSDAWRRCSETLHWRSEIATRRYPQNRSAQTPVLSQISYPHPLCPHGSFPRITSTHSRTPRRGAANFSPVVSRTSSPVDGKRAATRRRLDGSSSPRASRAWRTGTHMTPTNAAGCARPPADVLLPPAGGILAGRAPKAIDCYEYQSCEHAGWPRSEARALCAALRHRLIGELPGYDAAPWGIEDAAPVLSLRDHQQQLARRM